MVLLLCALAHADDPSPVDLATDEAHEPDVAAQVHTIWQHRPGARQWVTPALPEWPDAPLPDDAAFTGVRCDTLVSIDRDNGEVMRVQVRGCPEAFAEATHTALSTWQARTRDRESGQVAVRVGVTFVGNADWPAPVDGSPTELRILKTPPSSACIASLEITPRGRATIAGATRPGCLTMPVGNDWGGPFPNQGGCVVLLDTPLQATCEPDALSSRVPELLEGRIEMHPQWTGRRVTVQFAAPVRGVATPETLTATRRVAPLWDSDWLHEAPTPRVGCTADFHVSPAGKPDDLTIWGCPEPYASRVHDAVAQWTWEPPTLNGEPARLRSQGQVVLQLESTLPIEVPLGRYEQVLADTAWRLDDVLTEDCVVSMTVDAGGQVSDLASNRPPACLVVPDTVKIPGKWRKEASGPQACTFRIEAREARARLLSVSDCPELLQSKVLEGGGLDDWRFNGGPDPQLYEVMWTVHP